MGRDGGLRGDPYHFLRIHLLVLLLIRFLLLWLWCEESKSSQKYQHILSKHPTTHMGVTFETFHFHCAPDMWHIQNRTSSDAAVASEVPRLQVNLKQVESTPGAAKLIY